MCCSSSLSNKIFQLIDRIRGHKNGINASVIRQFTLCKNTTHLIVKANNLFGSTPNEAISCNVCFCSLVVRILWSFRCHPIIAEQELFTSRHEHQNSPISLESTKKNPLILSHMQLLSGSLQHIFGRTQQTTNPDPFIRY